jgi:hypothetical protein
MTVQLSGAIMAHPSRRAAAEALSAVLRGTPVVYDPRPGGSNSLVTALAAWASHPPGATHHLVVQDDVLATPALLDELAHAAGLFPDAALAAYANWDSFNGAVARLAVAAGAGWVEAVRWEHFPTLAAVLPAARLGAFLEFATDAANVHFEDDEVLFDFLRMTGTPAYVSAPALVEHGALASVAGNDLRRAAVHAGGAPLGARRRLLAHSITLCPLFWRGMPYTLVRTGALDDHAWRFVHWTAAAPRLGLSEELLRKRFTGEFPGADEELLFSLWVMALLLGLVPRAGHVTVSDAAGGRTVGPPPDEQVVQSALATLLPGALMESALPADAFAGQERLVLDIARHGYHEGLETVVVSDADSAS